MIFNQRKWQTLDFFALRQWVRVPLYAVAVSMYPIRSSYRYLKKLHKYGYLHRGRDITGRLVYCLSPKGARWLLRNRCFEPKKRRPLFSK
jgi:hypothetical protein